MKLESHNIFKALIGALAGPSAKDMARNPDGLPVSNIDGVPCAVDAVGGVIKAGEGKEQRWFELRLRDVTPRHLLTPEEQMDKNEREAEHKDWWLVSSSKRSCFVRAESRHTAIDDFLRRFPGESASGLDMPEAELARGFDFIDDEGDRIRVMEQDPIQPEDPQLPAPGQRHQCGKVGGGCCGGECSCGGCYPEPTGETDKGNSGLKPEDFYFGIGDSPDGAYVCLVPKAFWDANHCMLDEHFDVQHLLPPYLGEPDQEATWMLPDGKYGEDVAIDMVVAGFERSEELEMFLQ